MVHINQQYNHFMISLVFHTSLVQKYPKQLAWLALIINWPDILLFYTLSIKIHWESHIFVNFFLFLSCLKQIFKNINFSSEKNIWERNGNTINNTLHIHSSSGSGNNTRSLRSVMAFQGAHKLNEYFTLSIHIFDSLALCTTQNAQGT